MPQLLRIGPYTLYFRLNESAPLEPVHVHIAEGIPVKNGTKIWSTSTGKALVCHNKSKIPDRILQRFVRVIEANSAEFIQVWFDTFGEIRYYC